MERMPSGLGVDARPVDLSNLTQQVTSADDWRHGLPTLTSRQIILRELRPSDAPSMLALLTTPSVTQHISPPPATLEGFERFIAWTHRMRSEGSAICFGLTPAGIDTVIGIIQVRALEPGFKTAEWGFVIGSPFWGSGVFQDAARLALEFAFGPMNINRLEARACVQNGRGNYALVRLGATQEALLRRSFYRDTQWHDQVLYALVAEDWKRRSTVCAWSLLPQNQTIH